MKTSEACANGCIPSNPRMGCPVHAAKCTCVADFVVYGTCDYCRSRPKCPHGGPAPRLGEVLDCGCSGGPSAFLTGMQAAERAEALAVPPHGKDAGEESKELHRFRTHLKWRPNVCDNPPSSTDLMNVLCDLENDREALQAELDYFRRDYGNENAKLRADKDALQARVKSLKEELARLRGGRP